MVTDIGLGVVVAVGVLLGLVAGMVVGWIASRRMGRKDFALQSEALRAESESAVARVNAELIEAQGQIRVLETDRASLQGEKSSAKSLEDRLEPVREALEGLRRTTQQAEVERAKSAAELRTQIDGVQRNYTSLESATKQLVAAMSSGQSRGQWGEMQLEQLLEHSGLVEGVHFRRQDSRMTEAGGARPDVVVDLPGGGEILIDAKFPFDAYWRAIKADNETEVDAHLHKHAEDVLARAKELSSKRYWESNISPDFVVMFLPLESLLSSALETNGLLLEEVFARNVVLATPTTILGMLRTIQFGYQRKLMADNAEEIRAAGAEMLTRLEKAVDHLGTLRKGLMSAVKGYNEFIGSMDSRVMVQARRMKELGVASSTDLELPSDVTETLRESRSSE
ncbi:MAG: DNA recombination protein RmuC [Actinobacteria bacterium]|nr:DNA recombination protein RmuC [Actinomycetota bacterium]NDA58685.1 DNA recombination protein RmuC [Actinomycetota bacterium]NDH14040.1 DNA recombination protein RmuC [Actinomycetota bacterium]NDH18450.1 DNA recombination protein RmuC [Actinomycetota bacterium]